ncbi:hypothetical protein CCYA_CCYA14G3815 [Cyanidiococcus yangmingshanensis]|nr:hypothetical protein CCYA_CCYA14G3815 [Cyanidiococcus yangmingshanensis]
MQDGWRSTTHWVCGFPSGAEAYLNASCSENRFLAYSSREWSLENTERADYASARARSAKGEDGLTSKRGSDLYSRKLNTLSLAQNGGRPIMAMSAQPRELNNCAYRRCQTGQADLSPSYSSLGQIASGANAQSKEPCRNEGPKVTGSERSLVQYPMTDVPDASMTPPMSLCCLSPKCAMINEQLIRVRHVTRLARAEEDDSQGPTWFVGSPIRGMFWRWRQGFLVTAVLRRQRRDSDPGSSSLPDEPVAVSTVQRRVVSSGERSLVATETIQSAFNGPLRWRSYHDFIELRAHLQQKYSACVIPALPHIPFWFTLSELLATDRIRQVENALERFLKRTLEHPILGVDPVLESFIGGPVNYFSRNYTPDSSRGDKFRVKSSAGTRQKHSNKLRSGMRPLASILDFLGECRPTTLYRTLMRIRWRYFLRFDDWITRVILHPIQQPSWDREVSALRASLTRPEQRFDDLESELEEWASAMTALRSNVEAYEQSTRRLNFSTGALAETLIHMEQLKGAFVPIDSGRQEQGSVLVPCSDDSAPEPWRSSLRQLVVLMNVDSLTYDDVGENVDRMTSNLAQARVTLEREKAMMNAAAWKHFRECAEDFSGLFMDARRALSVLRSSRERYLYAAENWEYLEKNSETVRFPRSDLPARQQPDWSRKHDRGISEMDNSSHRSKPCPAPALDEDVTARATELAIAIELAKHELEDARNMYEHHARLFYSDLYRLMETVSREIANAVKVVAQAMRKSRS